MAQYYLLSVVSDDKPGIIKSIAQAVADRGGSWQESRLAQLDGQFAGIIRISVAPENATALEAELSNLAAQGIQVRMQPLQGLQSASHHQHARFTLAGPDRNGIVRELAHAFAQHNINVQELTTCCSSMPYSGDPLFEASGQVEIPSGQDLDPIREKLDVIADDLALDIQLEALD